MEKWIFLLRSFFPKWKFFDDVTPELRLEVRFAKGSAHDGQWVNALQPIRRSFRAIVFNPNGNRLHACHNHLNHFNSDLTSFQDNGVLDVTQLSTYQITKNMAQFQIEDRGWIERPYCYQFRLLVEFGKGGEASPHFVLTSPDYEVV